MKTQNRMSEAFKSFSEFSNESSIHSLKYLGRANLHIFERLFWVVAFLLSFGACTFLIAKIYIKWRNDPVVVILDERSSPTWLIPFPAITICPESKAAKDFLDISEVFNRTRHNYSISNEEEIILESLYQVCDFFDGGMWKLDPRVGNNTPVDYIEELRKVSIGYDKVSTVEWKGNRSSFKSLFHETVTDEGICHTFNMMDHQDMYRRALDPSLKFPKHGHRSDWTLCGYKSFEAQTYPHRVLGSGRRAGLVIVLMMNTSDIDYACKYGVNGYRITLHTPGETPRTSKQYYSIPLNAVSQVSVKPRVLFTSRHLQSYSPNERQCYFNSERKLKFHKIYTKQNCELECLTEFTLLKCDCVKFSMPHTNDTKICDYSQIDCYRNAEMEWILNEMESSVYECSTLHNHEDGTVKLVDSQHDRSYNVKHLKTCECLPTCTSIHYDTEISQTDMKINGMNKIQDNNALVYAVVNVYFKEANFIKLKRTELYGIIDFLANCGGFLGLFLGGSCLSLIEIVYHLTLKNFFKKRTQQKDLQTKESYSLVDEERDSI